MKYVALICARGNSKGLPKKNIKKLAGKPLIGWAIEQAKAVRGITRVIISTDSEEIAKIAKQYGGEVPFRRPANLALDDSPEWLVWRHALNYLNNEESIFPDALVIVPVTSPLREPTDIENCIHEYERGNVDTVITMTDAHRSPYFNMVVVDDKNYSQLVINTANKVIRRQDAPVVYDITTVAYVVNAGFLLSGDRIFSGRVRSVYIPPERAVDIDTSMDFKIAECMLNYLNEKNGISS